MKKIQNLVLFITLALSQLISAQTYEFHNSINFNEVNDGHDTPDGITWYKPAPLSYGIYRTNGAWSAPNFQQLKLYFDTGIIIDGGSLYGKSGTIIQPNGGFVGIGTNNPSTELDVVGNIKTTGSAPYVEFKPTHWSSSAYVQAGANATGTNTGDFVTFIAPATKGYSFMQGAQSTVVINSNGNVGIGTTTTGSHKLAVEGSIGAREVKVYTTAWADFVFKKEYTLPTLAEVEKQISEKGHLTNIPSEEEVVKNGINLGEMNAKLLQKIEELTLYAIEQNKKIEGQSKEIEALKNLVLRVTKIETELKQK